MNIKDLTCTPEQGQELAKLGVTAKSMFVAFKGLNGWEYAMSTNEIAIVHHFDPIIGYFATMPLLHPVFTLGELMRMVNAGDERYIFRKAFDLWHMAKTTQNVHPEGFATMEQAAADRIIIELSNNRLTPDQCNSALGGNKYFF